MKPRRSCTMAETTFCESPSAIVRCRNATRSCAVSGVASAPMSSSTTPARALVEWSDMSENVPSELASGETLAGSSGAVFAARTLSSSRRRAVRDASAGGAGHSAPAATARDVRANGHAAPRGRQLLGPVVSHCSLDAACAERPAPDGIHRDQDVARHAPRSRLGRQAARRLLAPNNDGPGAPGKAEAGCVLLTLSISVSGGGASRRRRR
jgi:hypothetical protein